MLPTKSQLKLGRIFKPTNQTNAFKDEHLYYRDQLIVPASSEWCQRILHEFHSAPKDGHTRVIRTYLRVKRSFNWPGLKRAVKKFVAECEVCQKQNYEAIHPPGLIQPLTIPSDIWQGIFMDFVEGLPISQGKNSLLVVVDRLSKYGHFIPLTHHFTTSKVVDVFVKENFRLHDMLKSMVSDRDLIFMSNLWPTLFKNPRYYTFP